MRAPGLVATIKLAVTLVFALPLVWFGLDWLASGRPAGAVFVALGVAALVLQHYLTNPFDPTDLAEAATDYVTDDDR